MAYINTPPAWSKLLKPWKLSSNATIDSPTAQEKRDAGINHEQRCVANSSHCLYCLDPHEKCRRCRSPPCDFRDIWCNDCKEVHAVHRGRLRLKYKNAEKRAISKSARRKSPAAACGVAPKVGATRDGSIVPATDGIPDRDRSDGTVRDGTVRTPYSDCTLDGTPRSDGRAREDSNSSLFDGSDRRSRGAIQ